MFARINIITTQLCTLSESCVKCQRTINYDKRTTIFEQENRKKTVLKVYGVLFILLTLIYGYANIVQERKHVMYFLIS